MDSPQSRSPSQRPRKGWWRRLRHTARTWSNRFPRLGRMSTRIWRTAKYPFLRYKGKLSAYWGRRAGTYVHGIDVDRVFYVPSQSIEYCSLRGFNIRHFKGRVVPGDWDKLEKRFEDLDVYVAFRQVFLEGLDWPDTVYYQRNIEFIKAGYIRWGCKNKSEFDQRCKELELLFRAIQQDGYKSQRELVSSHKDLSPPVVDNEVIVSIGRHGDLLFSDGAHRLAIAKLLGIESIPVVVAVRHPEWVEHRQDLIRRVGGTDAAVHQPLTHPDLGDMAEFRAGERQ